MTTRKALQPLVGNARSVGYAEADQSYEDDVFGLAAPFFGADGLAIGAVAVATPCHRLTPEAKDGITAAVMWAAIDLSRKLGHEPPPEYMDLYRRRAP